jgi:hypothetical protein
MRSESNRHWLHRYISDGSLAYVEQKATAASLHHYIIMIHALADRTCNFLWNLRNCNRLLCYLCKLGLKLPSRVKSLLETNLSCIPHIHTKFVYTKYICAYLGTYMHSKAEAEEQKQKQKRTFAYVCMYVDT